MIDLACGRRISIHATASPPQFAAALKALEDGRAKIETWRRNESRPHTSLGWLTPIEYAAAAAKIAAE